MSENEETDLNTFIKAADLSIEQDLFDGANPTAKLVVTVHKKGRSSLGNVWYFDGSGGEPIRYVEERKVDADPDYLMLMGEVSRLAGKIQAGENKNDRFILATKALMERASILVKHD